MKGGGSTTTSSSSSLSPSGSSPSSSNNGSTIDTQDLKTLQRPFGILAIVFLAYVVVRICGHLLSWWVRRVEQRRPQQQALPERVMTTRVCESLPKTTYGGGGNDGKISSATTGCAICLSDKFEAGEEIRVFPECGHGFHAECVDVWLVSHVWCPLCRRMMWRLRL